MKRIGSLVLLCLLTLSLFAACGRSYTPEDNDWYIDRENHWKVDEGGNRIDVVSHSFEGNTCTRCGAQLSTSGGKTSLRRYNTQGEIVYLVTYDSEGKIAYECRYEYTYAADGSLLTRKDYEGDLLVSQSNYKKNADGDDYVCDQTLYEKDGSRYYMEYSEMGDMSKEVNYDADGTPLSETTYAYEYDDNDMRLRYETYRDGKLASVYEYKYSEDKEYTYEYKFTEYMEDGSKMVCEYTEDGEFLYEKFYDAEGNEIPME